MRVNKWTWGLATVGLVSIPSIMMAEEKASPVMTALSSTMISGYVDTSAQWDLGTGNANPPGFIYNAGKQDGFNLNKVKLRVEKPLDESQWSAGYRADLQFGPDANTFGSQSLGVRGDFAIQQAYVAIRAPLGNGLDFKMGVFDSIIGYESHDSHQNPNYTRSWGTTIEPHTHTGLLATYQIVDWLSAAAGIANTFGPRINEKAHPVGGGAVGGPRAESYKTYMASVALTAPENFGFLKGSTLYAGLVNGFNNVIPAVVFFNETHYYVGVTMNTPVSNLKVGASYDYAAAHSDSSVYGPVGPAGDSAYANATALYASFQATEKLSFHARGEYMSHSFGTLPTGIGSLPGKVVSATGTIQYDLWQNVLTRLELRWDHAANGDPAFGGDVTGAPTKKNNVLVAANVIYKF